MVCRDGKGREKIKWLKDWSWPWRTRVTWQRIQPIIDTPASKAEGVHNLPSPRVDCDNTGHFVHKAIRKSCRENGLEDTLKNVSSFIVNYAEDNAIQLPRRIPGYKRTDLQLLPCSTTKRSVWEQYSVVAVQVGQRSLSYQTFCRVWKQFLLNIMPARPMIDLCAVCHHNAGLILQQPRWSVVCVVMLLLYVKVMISPLITLSFLFPCHLCRPWPHFTVVCNRKQLTNNLSETLWTLFQVENRPVVCAIFAKVWFYGTKNSVSASNSLQTENPIKGASPNNH